MHSDAFDVIPYEDIKGDWKKLGSGSFGNVYKGVYLGIDVAIKEVLPSKDYDVAKYFEREWRLMKECRHPNICLFIGLSRAPPPDNRIFIISEFIENGNVRMYIHDKSKPFPWRLRLSFATDVARALAYLHARKCIHRDLKGENLLVTANGRLKVTDFGFARIAARNEEESKRLTFCGTDSYMSPEILLGEEFDLPTDIYSLGIILCEIAARQLADDNHFKRYPPTFDIDAEELHKRADPGCPNDFLSLCLDCLALKPSDRPTTREILERLRVMEADLLVKPEEGEDIHVGSIKFMSGGKRQGPAPRIPSFGMGVGNDVHNDGSTSDECDEEYIAAVMGLSTVSFDSSTSDHEPLLQGNLSSISSEYSTTVIKARPSQTAYQTPSLSSVLTIRQARDPNGIPDSQPEAASPAIPPATVTAIPVPPNRLLPGGLDDLSDPLNTSSIFSIDTLDSYHTATASSLISSARATEGGSTIRSLRESLEAPLLHRFTLLKSGAKPKHDSGNTSPKPKDSNEQSAGWKPLDLIFSSRNLGAKCDVCGKRLGWKPILECDDCGLRAHVKCSEDAPADCGVRPPRVATHHQSHFLLGSMSPLSKVKQSSSNANLAKEKSTSPPR